jgi:molecular chaperone GrpE
MKKTQETSQEQAQEFDPAQIDPEAIAAQEQAAQDPIAALEAQLATAQQDVLYARAELQNTRRRMEKELADTRAYAATNFARDILSVADNLERALAALPADLLADERLKPVVTGLEATGRELTNVFERHGVKKMQEVVGSKLDPNLHQAMLEQPSGEAEAGTILHEMAAGYTIKERLLRPAMVVVAKAAE